MIVTGSGDATVRDRSTGYCRQTLEGHKYDTVISVAIERDVIVTGSEDETVKVWDRCSRLLAYLCTCMIVVERGRYILTLLLSAEKGTT